MRIAIVTNNPDFFLSHRLGWGKFFRESGHDVSVICPNGESVKEILSEGFKHYSVRVERKGINPLNELISIFSHRDAIVASQADVVLNFTIKSILHGTVGARLAGVKHIVNTFTGFGTLFIQNRPIYKVLRAFLSVFFRVLFSSARVRCVFQNHDDFKAALDRGWCSLNSGSVIVGSGVDTEKFNMTTEVEKEEKIILFPSRLLYDKGISELVEACSRLSTRRSDFKLWIVGEVDAENKSAVKPEDLNKWKKINCIDFLGFQSDMPGLMEQSSIVCLPSYREGAPKSLIEACAVGRAIVTTDVPGCREVVTNGVNGLLVTSHSVDELEVAIERLLDNPTLRKEMGEKGRRRAELEFRIQNVLSRFEVETGIAQLDTKLGEVA